MNTKNILGGDEYDKFIQLVKLYATPSDDYISKCEGNPYVAVEICDNVIDTLNSITKDIKSDIENKVMINVNRLVKIKEAKIAITNYRQKILDQIAAEEKIAADLIKEIESM